MFFCPKCNNSFDITNKIDTKQTGGKTSNSLNVDDIIQKALSNTLEKSDVIGISIEQIEEAASFKKLKQKNRENIYNIINDMLPNNSNNDSNIDHHAYFICLNCSYSVEIEPNTLIFSRTSSEVSQSYTTSDVKNMRYSDILPYTRKYICPNKSCVSHTDPTKKEAKFCRKNNSYCIRYICMACDSDFDL